MESSGISQKTTLATLKLASFATGYVLNLHVLELACFDGFEKQADRTGLKIRPFFMPIKLASASELAYR